MDTIGAFILPAAAVSKAGLAVREPIRAQRMWLNSGEGKTTYLN
jgi:hypothetical protein